MTTRISTGPDRAVVFHIAAVKSHALNPDWSTHHRGIAVKPAIILLAIAAAIGAFFLVGPRFSSGAAPDFTLSTRAGAGGQSLSLSDLKGRVVVLDFWASWCPPCRAAIPALEKIHRDYQSHGVAVIGINVSDNADPHEFMASMNATYTVLVDNGTAARAYRVRGIPTLVVIDKSGKIRYRESGFGGATEGELRQAIDAALSS